MTLCKQPEGIVSTACITRLLNSAERCRVCVPDLTLHLLSFLLFAVRFYLLFGDLFTENGGNDKQLEKKHYINMKPERVIGTKLWLFFSSSIS